jgi:hypothetical protein
MFVKFEVNLLVLDSLYLFKGHPIFNEIMTSDRYMDVVKGSWVAV